MESFVQAEDRIRVESRRWLLERADASWMEGDTKTALRRYENALTSRQELSEKVQLLERAHIIYQEWYVQRGRLRASGGCPNRENGNHFAHMSITKSTIFCAVCDAMEKLSEDYATRLYKVLGWSQDLQDTELLKRVLRQRDGQQFYINAAEAFHAVISRMPKSLPRPTPVGGVGGRGDK